MSIWFPHGSGTVFTADDVGGLDDLLAQYPDGIAKASIHPPRAAIHWLLSHRQDQWLKDLVSGAGIVGPFAHQLSATTTGLSIYGEAGATAAQALADRSGFPVVLAPLGDLPTWAGLQPEDGASTSSHNGADTPRQPDQGGDMRGHPGGVAEDPDNGDNNPGGGSGDGKPGGGDEPSGGDEPGGDEPGGGGGDDSKDEQDAATAFAWRGPVHSLTVMVRQIDGAPKFPLRIETTVQYEELEDIDGDPPQPPVMAKGTVKIHTTNEIRVSRAFSSLSFRVGSAALLSTESIDVGSAPPLLTTTTTHSQRSASKKGLDTSMGTSGVNAKLAVAVERGSAQTVEHREATPAPTTVVRPTYTGATVEDDKIHEGHTFAYLPDGDVSVRYGVGLNVAEDIWREKVVDVVGLERHQLALTVNHPELGVVTTLLFVNSVVANIRTMSTRTLITTLSFKLGEDAESKTLPGQIPPDSPVLLSMAATQPKPVQKTSLRSMLGRAFMTKNRKAPHASLANKLQSEVVLRSSNNQSDAFLTQPVFPRLNAKFEPADAAELESGDTEARFLLQEIT